MTVISKNQCIDKLTDIVNKYNNTTKMRPVYVKCCTYSDFGVENNGKDTKFKVGDHVRILKF